MIGIKDVKKFATPLLPELREKCAQIFTKESLRDYQEVRRLVIQEDAVGSGCFCERMDSERILNILSTYFIHKEGVSEDIDLMQELIRNRGWALC